jgi:hypothetical protein
MRLRGRISSTNSATRNRTPNSQGNPAGSAAGAECLAASHVLSVAVGGLSIRLPMTAPRVVLAALAKEAVIGAPFPYLHLLSAGRAGHDESR